MTDYTPTTEDPLGDWFRRIGTALSNEDYETGIQVLVVYKACAAKHHRKIAAEALREAAETFARTVGEPAHPGRSVVCLDMYTGVVTDVQTWLRERADRIEQGGES